MNIELSKTVKPTVVLCVVISVVGLFFNYRFSLGVVLGVVISIIHLLRLERNITLGLANKKKLSSWIFMFITDLILLAIPFMAAAIWPQAFDFIGGAVGLLLNKIIIYSMNLRRKE